MELMMDILRFISRLRNPVFDFFFSLVTHIGEETFFLAISIFIYWCVNKREGFYVLFTGLVGTVVNQALKLLFAIPRPWVYDKDFKPVESAIPEATGYSFPSGHTQNVTGTFGSIAKSHESKGVRIFSIVVIVLVSFSRLYLGVHTPADVAFSLLFGTALVFLLHPIFATDERMNKYMPYLVVAANVITSLLVIYVFLVADKTADPENAYAAKKIATTMFGFSVAMVPVCFLDRKYINFKTEARWYVQVIKLVVGLAVILGLKAGLSAPLTALFGNEYIARAVRYFIIVMFAGTLWPMTFPLLCKINIPAFNALGDKLKKTK